MRLLVEVILTFDFDTSDNAVFIRKNCTAETLISEFNAAFLQPVVHRNADAAAGIIFCEDGSRSTVAAKSYHLVSELHTAFDHHVVAGGRLFNHRFNQSRMI